MQNSSFISPKAIIDKSAYIGNNVRIFGATKIGPNCYIDDNVVIGYPSKNALNEMVKSGNVPTDLIELDNRSNGETVLSGSCCVRFGSVISVATYISDNVYCDINTQIGAFCKIGKNTQLLYGARIYNNVTIGEDCRIGGFCCNRSTIENKVSMFGELVHSYRNPVGGLIEPSPIVRSGATVGWHSIVVGNVEIGQDVYVAAGAIVIKSVPKQHVVIGSQSKVIPISEWGGRLTREYKKRDDE
ncbi:MAG: hypothetical protein ACE5HI_10930 [bacterium]